MAWTVPDKGTVPVDAQAILFQVYLDVLSAGVAGDAYVTATCAVTGNGDLFPTVAAGSVVIIGTTYAVAGGKVTISAADPTNPRFDLVVANSSGLAVRTGTAAAAPKPPSLTSGDVVLAVVYVAAATTSIASSQIVDMRVLRDDLVAVSLKVAAIDLSQDFADLERRYRLLLKRHVEMFDDVPPGLEDEVPIALETS